MQLRPAGAAGQDGDRDRGGRSSASCCRTSAPMKCARWSRRAYAGKFETDELTPVVPVGDACVLELFRGPTSAFKDVALSVLPRLIVGVARQARRDGRDRHPHRHQRRHRQGGAGGLQRRARHAHCRCSIPTAASATSSARRWSRSGARTCRVCAIRGNFDDAQAGVKAIFADDEANGWAAKAGVRLSSANSINLGRLAPQVAYYFKAYVDLVLTGAAALGDEVNFVVPDGQFRRYPRRRTRPAHGPAGRDGWSAPPTPTTC